MADTKTILCITHYDLDGIGSCLATKWYYEQLGYRFEYLCTSTFGFREKVLNHSLQHKLDTYEKIIITDLDVTKDADIIDLPNVIIIDHHKSHADNKKYVNAVSIVKEYSSAALLCYKVYTKLFDTIKLTSEQKLFIALCDDYDSFKHKCPESIKMNVIFWNMQNSFVKFMDIYRNGYVNFTTEQDNIYHIFEEDLKVTLKNLETFQIKKYRMGTSEPYDSVDCRVIAAFATKHINEVACHLIDKLGADVAIVVNLSTKHVSIRRSKECEANVALFAEDMLGGGGHEYSAGGTITDAFMEFTQGLRKM